MLRAVASAADAFGNANLVRKREPFERASRLQRAPFGTARARSQPPEPELVLRVDVPGRLEKQTELSAGKPGGYLSVARDDRRLRE